MTLSPERLAITIAAHAADRKASDIVALDLREVAGYTDFFVICSGNTDRQTKAIHDAINMGLKKHAGLVPRREFDPQELLAELPASSAAS